MRWDVITPEDVASAKSYAEQLRIFARYCQQVVGTPLPPSRQAWAALGQRVKAFFIEYPQADWYTLCRIAQWCRNRKLRIRTTTGLIGCFRSAWADGALPELDPQNLDLDLEREIERALSEESREEWRRRLIVARGTKARRAALEEWKAASAETASTPTSALPESGATGTKNTSSTRSTRRNAKRTRREVIVLDLGPAPSPPLSTNEERRLHWGSRCRRLDPWKNATIVLAKQQQISAQVDSRPSRVQLVIPFRSRGRRDPHNYVGTNVKACVDGLVRAGVWPDDTPRWVEVLEPRLVVGRNAQIEIEPKEP